MNNSKPVRVRFAPSPTGPLHIGGVRTALYNYLFAKKHGGQFLLRIEDTDQTRYVPGAEEYIIESLKWCGITVDEGVTAGGPHAPYRQSERKPLYKEYAEQLVKTGFAYYAFDTPEELTNLRLKLEQEKAPNTSYCAASRMQMTNSLTLSETETTQRIQEDTPYVIRFKMPEHDTIVVQDIIRGEVKVNSATLDDKVLYKSDGMPTYHLANIVDDHLMQISHVIRGEEWLPSLPLHIMLYKALNWHETMPEFAHLPLLLKPNGNGKLSKRDGDKLGFPVFPLQWKNPEGEISSGYRESGYFAEGFINMLAFLGWNPGTEKELYSMDELIESFTLERVGKSGSKFDPEKTKWFNHQYLIRKTDKELATLYIQELKERGISTDLASVTRIVSLVKERVEFVSELWNQSDFFFEAPTTYDAKVVKKRWKENTPALMQELITVLERIEDFSSENTEKQLKVWITDNELNMGAVMNAFRLCVVGAGRGPHMFDIIDIIGKQETIKRIQTALQEINK